MIRKGLFLMFALAFVTVLPGSKLPEPIPAVLDSMIQEGLRQKAFPGASLVVGDREGVRYANTYGFHDYTQQQLVTDEDLFDVASCTKVLSTTFVVMRLCDEGRLQLEQPLAQYLSEWIGTSIGSVTLNELLTHTSGMRPQVFYHALVHNATGTNLFSGKRSEAYPHQVGENYFVARDVAYDTTFLRVTPCSGWRQAADRLYVNPMVDTLITGQIQRDYNVSRRGSYSYSDTNFLFLRWIAERVRGESLAVLTESLFSELGCANTYYNPLRYRSKEQCLPTETDYLLCRGSVRGYVHDELGALMGGVGGNAGLFTTAHDIGRFCEMILNRGFYNGKQLLTPQTIDRFIASPYASSGVWRGLGFDKRNPTGDVLGGETSFGHTGFTGTIFWMDARKGVYMVFLSNAVYPSRINNKLSASKLRTKLWAVITRSM